MSDDSKLILEGGAGGHMAHPFELNVVKTGADLKNFFLQAAEHLQEKPGATKIDGTNVSFKVVGQQSGQRQFAIDRGSLQEIDVNGVTIDRVSERFKTKDGGEHGMVRMCTMTLRILNSALDEIQPELEALGMWDDPSIYINAEFVEGTTNVTKYDYNFLALHVVQQFYEKHANTETKTGKPTNKLPRPGLPRPMITVVDDETGEEKEVVDKKAKSKILSSSDGIDPSALRVMVKKLKPFAEKFNFKVFDTIPTQIKQGDGGPKTSLVKNVQEALNTKFEVKTSNNSISNTLEQWLGMMDSKGGIPKSTFIHTPSGRTVTPLSKACYMHVSSGRPVEDMILGVGEDVGLSANILRTPDIIEQEFNSAIFGAAVTEVTRVLGNAIMAGLETEGGVMGDMSNHEGIVLKLEDMSQYSSMSGFVKITGEFIVAGATGGGFGEKPATIGEGEADEEGDPSESLPGQESGLENASSHKRRIVVYPGKFKPPHRGHLGLVEALAGHLARPQDKVLVLVSPLSVKTDDGLEISAKDSKKIWNLFLDSKGLGRKVDVLISPMNSPVKAAYAVLDNEIDGHETLPGDFIIPGASTKLDPKSKKPDWERFARFSEYNPTVEGVSLGEAEEWAVSPIESDDGVEFSATNFRIAIDNKEDLSDFLPDGVSQDEFYRIMHGAQEISENYGTNFQKKMKKRLGPAHSRLLDNGGQQNSAPYTQPRSKKSNAFLAKEDLEMQEMSTAGGAAASIEGSPAANKKKRKNKTSYNVFKEAGAETMSYEQFAEEIKLRKAIKENFKKVRKNSLIEKRSKILNTLRLKNIITDLIYEVAVQKTKDDPHENTGINKLDQLLRTIIPTIEEDFKSLTTDPGQRKSFRAHILHAVRHLLAPVQASEDLEDEQKTDLSERRADVTLDIDAPDEEKFIDIYKDDKKEEEDPKEKFTIDGEDETGRNAAYDCFQKIEKQILKAFQLLGNEEDRELFYDYLLTNLKLYFDQFEKDLTTTDLEEPTTPEYEKEKDDLQNMAGEPEEELGVA